MADTTSAKTESPAPKPKGLKALLRRSTGAGVPKTEHKTRPSTVQEEGSVLKSTDETTIAQAPNIESAPVAEANVVDASTSGKGILHLVPINDNLRQPI